MPGAVRPPWIEKEEFYHMPFNFCDRWCEKCQLNDICKIHQEELESKATWIAAGKDPNSWEYVFETVSKSLTETFALLAKEAEKMGIDLNKIEDVPEEEPKPKAFRVYRLAQKLCQALKRVISDLEVVPIDANVDLVLKNVEIISFYSTLICPKIYRATKSKFGEDKDPLLKEYCGDSRISAFIAVNSLEELIGALSELESHSPLRPMREKFIRLKNVVTGLIKIIEAEFELEDKSPILN